MKHLHLFLLVSLTVSLGSNAFAAKEVFERTKPHCNIGTIGHVDAALLPLAIALASGRSVEDAVDAPTGVVSATVETDDFTYDITSDPGATAGAKSEDAYFVKVDRSTMTMSQTREHILLARQTGIAVVVVFLNLDTAADPRVDALQVELLKELLRDAGYGDSHSGVVAGSLESALAQEKGGLSALVELMDTTDRLMSR